MPHRRTIAVLTTGRQDWGILHSTCLAIGEHEDLHLRLIVGGMHLSPRFGLTIDEVRADGFEPDDVLDWLGGRGTGEAGASSDPSATQQAGRALELVGDALETDPPDCLVLVGDRLETMAAAVAATVERVPIVHLHGGEQTLGAFDDGLRHAITKLSHLHLVSHEEHARRVVALGEDPALVQVVGSPGLDAAVRPDLPDGARLEAELGIRLEPPVVIVTVHPATLDPDPAAVADAVVAAMDAVGATYVVTLPNADPGGAEVRTRMVAAAKGPRRIAVEALRERRYWGLMRIADAMLGNSSSGIVEAPAVDLPVVNVGDRQLGRRREANVIEAAVSPAAVTAALRDALGPETRRRIALLHPPLADGQAGRRVADIIAGWRPPHPPRKRPIPVP
ncbi:MAG TPA: UDP-N-acetylglucosamine 2-epimerase [Candidatus Acidoferrum sp.]|nr:UDP-N-acetylglucosamine 2-epimerase [Candidatus Acidoferrum sp.]